MLITLLLQIILSIFTAFGFYSAVNLLFFYILYPKKIRNAIEITPKTSPDDTKEEVELKIMCVKHIKSML